MRRLTEVEPGLGCSCHVRICPAAAAEWQLFLGDLCPGGRPGAFQQQLARLLPQVPGPVARQVAGSPHRLLLQGLWVG